MKITSVLLFLLCIIFFQIPLSSEIYSRLEGIVKDKDTGTSLENVEVLLYEFDHLSKRKRIYRNNTTDIKGHFIIDNIRVRDKARFSYFLSFRKSGYVPIVPEYQVLHIRDIFKVTDFLNLKQGENRFLEIELEKGGSIKVTLFKKEESGIFPYLSENVALAIRNLDKNVYGREGLTISSERIGSDGFVRFDSLSPGDGYFILSIIEGLPALNQNVSIEKNKETEFNYTYDLTDKTGISGTVTRNGQPFHGTYVHLRDEQDRFVSHIRYSLENGGYKFVNLIPGKYRISFLNEDENEKELEKEFWVFVQKNKSTILNVNFD